MASSQDVSPGAAARLPFAATGTAASPRRFRAKFPLAAAILVGLASVMVFALVREATVTGRTSATTIDRPSRERPRVALTKAEEAYAQALWAIHSQVKDGAYRMTFGGLHYRLGQIDAAELGRRVREATEIFGRAEASTRSLGPPPSLGSVHALYLDAIGLFKRSAAEMLLASEDGRPAHLMAAYPLGEEASRKLLEVGNAIWPGEYLPN